MRHSPLIIALTLCIFSVPQAREIACVGNSITAGYHAGNTPYPQWLGQLLGKSDTVRNEGVSGTFMSRTADLSRTYWTTSQFKDVFAFAPNIITIKLGTNDANTPTSFSVAGYKKDYLAMIDTFNTIKTKPRIYLVFPVPIWNGNVIGGNDTNILKAITVIKQIALERGLPTIDCYTPMQSRTLFYTGDGLHPDSVGADTLAHIFYRSIAGTPAMRFQTCSYTFTEGTQPFRLFLPEEYGLTKQKYPLILTLHDFPQSGTNNTAQITNNRLAEIWAEDSVQSKQKCIVASPQCPTTDKWVGVGSWSTMFYSTSTITQSTALTLALKMVDSLIKVFPIDTNRIYITGVSMGGYGVWDALARHPGKFAAAIPMSGGCDTAKASVIKNTPIWAFHGALDDTVPPAATQAMIARIKALGTTVTSYTAQYNTYFGNSTITRAALSTAIDGGAKTLYGEYTDGKHGVWVSTYNDPLVQQWLFKQVKSSTAIAFSSHPNTLMSKSASSLIPVFAGSNFGSVLKSLTPGEHYELREFDCKGVLIAKAYVGATKLQSTSAFPSLQSAQAIRWVSVRKL